MRPTVDAAIARPRSQMCDKRRQGNAQRQNRQRHARRQCQNERQPGGQNHRSDQHQKMGQGHRILRYLWNMGRGAGDEKI